MAATLSRKKPLKVTPARLRDLPHLRTLFERATREHFNYFPPEAVEQVIREHSLLRLLKAYADRRRVLLVARYGVNVVGYCVAAVPRQGPAQLFWLYVDTPHRGTNTGLSLLSRTLKAIEERGGAEVFLATHDHRRYYERQGFRHTGQTMQYGVPLDIMKFTIRRLS